MALHPTTRKEFRRHIIESLRDEDPDKGVVKDLLFYMKQAWTTGVMDGLKGVPGLTDAQRIAIYARITQ